MDITVINNYVYNVTLKLIIVATVSSIGILEYSLGFSYGLLELQWFGGRFLAASQSPPSFRRVLAEREGRVLRPEAGRNS